MSKTHTESLSASDSVAPHLNLKQQGVVTSTYGTNDLLVSNVLRTNELQAWFLTEHLMAATPVAG